MCIIAARAPDSSPVDWPTRMNIAMGLARGLHHLHTDANMVHGNITSNNILLDEGNDAKIADCGLSRLMSAAANSSVIAAAGALGYRAPELSKLKKANTKTDIYSLGVVMLELLTGKSPGTRPTASTCRSGWPRSSRRSGPTRCSTWSS